MEVGSRVPRSAYREAQGSSVCDESLLRENTQDLEQEGVFETIAADLESSFEESLQ
jgi:hypothetical protein